MCDGGGRGERSDKRRKPRGGSLIYLYGTACTADPSGDGRISKVGSKLQPVESGDRSKVNLGDHARFGGGTRLERIRGDAKRSQRPV